MELTEFGIHTVRNGVFPSNTYLLQSRVNTTCLVIDPGLDTAKIESAIASLRLEPIAIIATHGHFDHIGSVSVLKEKFGIPYYLHENDLRLSQSANFYLRLAKINSMIKTPKPDILLKGKEETLEIGDFKLTMRNFPGHSEGSCIIQHDNCLFSGDIIYKKGLGFNNFPGENLLKLKNSIREVFNSYSEDSIVLPGHGEPEYLGKIKSNNTELINFLN